MTATLDRLVGRLRHWADPMRTCGPTDRQLLDRFAAHRDEAAFAELVRRHAPMVLGVARRVLQNTHDAEDVSQAAFLVLARKAGSAGWQDSIAGWLFPVVYHLALKVRGKRERTRDCETRAGEGASLEQLPDRSDELREVLDEELDRLPDHWRNALVLCYLEGRTQQEAAGLLGVSAGEIRGRLERARNRLRECLTRRGLALSATGLAAWSAAGAQAASPEMIEATTRAALLFAARTATASTATALARGVLTAMLLAKLKRVFLVMLIVSALVGGALLLPAPAPGDDLARPVARKADGKEPQPERRADAPKAKHCIVLWMSGGPSQMDTFDLKPGTANGGPFKEILTTAPGVKISEHFPKLAWECDKLAIIRSMTHGEGDHQRSTYLMRTGHTIGQAIDHPPLTSVLAKELSDGKLNVPPYVSLLGIPGFGNPPGPGFLPAEFGPLVVREKQPNSDLKLPDIEAFQGLNKDRAEAMRKGVEKAFDLADEKKEVRDAYGKHSFGQSCLLARRLVERGVPVVEVTLGGWDTHANGFTAIQRLCEVLDPAWDMLMKDLKQRGLLDSTLIVWMGEFGRTPRINANEGRDHWPRSFCVVLGGCGIKGGTVIGKTTDDGITIKEHPVTPAELHATIYRALGIDPTKELKTKTGEAVPLVEKGNKEVKEALK
jgi:RNA polymerase sigma factor (sigma-70 family)